MDVLDKAGAVRVICCRVLVMDRGSVVELDSPVQLLQQHGLFQQMCLQAGLIPT